MVGRCPACPGVNHCISGDGPQCNDSTVVCLGEAPGRDEQRRQQVFIGKTGRELNEHYLLLAGLRRGQNVYVTNAKIGRAHV